MSECASCVKPLSGWVRQLKFSWRRDTARQPRLIGDKKKGLLGGEYARNTVANRFDAQYNKWFYERAVMDNESASIWHEYPRWGPFFAGGLVVGVLLGFAVGQNMNNGTGASVPPTPVTEDESSNGDSVRQLELALTKQDESLAAGDFGAAYDYLLAAARLAPSDPRLLATVFAFIEKAATAGDADASFLAEDLYSRSDMLIPYQPVETISDSRKKYDQLSTLFENQVSPQPNWFAEVSILVSKAADTNKPLDIRVQLLDQARSQLDDLALRGVSDAFGVPVAKSFWEQHGAIASRHAEIESEAISAIYGQEQQSAQSWLKKTNSKTAEPISPKDVQDFITKLNANIQDGYAFLRTLSPYSASKVSDSVEVSREIQDRISQLERTKAWTYNQQALRRIQAVEKLENEPGLEKLRLIAEIHEDQLSPYIQRRFQKAWDEAFESCSDEEKVAAVKMRILRAKE